MEKTMTGFVKLALSGCYLLLIIFIISCNDTGKIKPADNSQADSLLIPHLVKHGTSTQLMVNGKPFLMISGEIHNSTCGGFESMRPVWNRMAQKNLNSVIASVSWELVEPEEGRFDFSLVDSIIAGAREANLKIALIWFASWKNGGSSYVPPWVKTDLLKYPRVKDNKGRSLEILSTFGEASLEADKRAFTALMRHIRETDASKQTVVAIQVQNEMGVVDRLGDPPGNAGRDYCDEANKAFYGPVPEMLMDYLVKNKGNLHSELYKVWESNGFKTKGTWEEIFGKSVFRPDIKDYNFYSLYTEELFSAWNFARHTEEIVSAGKKEYPLPMFVNAMLKQTYAYWPGKFFSGGPLPQVFDIWNAGAPSVDFLAPDIYSNDFIGTCRDYTVNGNPLFIPESRGGATGVARAFCAFSEYNAICFAPFGIDGGDRPDDPLPGCYKILNNMSSFILDNQGKGSMRGIFVDTVSPVQNIDLGKYTLSARLAGGSDPGIAGGLITNIGPDEFIVA